MKRLHLTLTVAIAVVVLGITGAAVALVNDAQEPTGPALAPLAGTFAEGTTPGGTRYTVSRLDTNAPSTMFCYEIATGETRAQGCTPIPDADGEYEGKPIRPGSRLLGPDRFVGILAADGVDGMRVTLSDGTTIPARSVEVEGVGRLLLATWSGEPVTTSRPEGDRTVELLGRGGSVDRVVTLKD